MAQARFKAKRPSNRSCFIIAETLEIRRLFSVVLADPQARPSVEAHPAVGFPTGSSSPQGYSPTQIRGAYGIDNIRFNGLVGDGTGQTVAIVVAYDNPKFVNSTDPNFNTSDLHLFDVAMGLPDPPSFTKVDQNGGSSYPGTDPYWANEAALDVEWVHAIAPQANILLVESSSTNLSNLIEGAASYATTVPGVSAITMSFSVNEFLGETSYDSFLQSPSSHGVTFVAASGDNGSPGAYPAFSPNVVAVGDTTLSISGNNYNGETGYNSSGGGISAYESKPDYQLGVHESSTLRTIPDVAFSGDKNSGVSVYDSFNGGSLPWYKVGGTSFSAPAWAALIAIANQGRAHEGLGSLDGPSQTLPRLYSLATADFHDITSGSNGSSAKAGYDLVTGLGTPVADKLISDLAGGNSVSGVVFTDSNGNGIKDSNELTLNNVAIFTDVYRNGIFQGADQRVTSGSDGTFTLSDIPGGTFRISATAPAGYSLTTAANYSVTGTYGSSATGKDFGFKATNIPAKLAFVGVSADATAGTVISPAISVNVVDNSGAIVASDNSTVTLSVASGPGTIGGTVTATAINGVATFNALTLSTAGAYTLKATDGSLTSATSSTITVQPNTTTPDGATLAFGQQPTGTTTGTAINPAITVRVLDSSGNLLTSDGSAVTLLIASGTGVLGGTTTVNAVNGIASFTDITLPNAGTFTLSANDGALAAITSSPFTIAAIPAKLGFTQPPTGTIAGNVIVPAITVSVLDAGGAVDVTDTSPVTLSIATGSGTLGGTLTVNAVNGVATFSDITVSTPGDFTLAATDGSLTGATSASFTVGIPGTLVPKIVKSTLATSLVAGSKVHANILLTQTSSAANTSTGSVTTRVYATGNGTPILLGSTTKKQTIKAGKSYSASVPILSLPAGLNGSYTLQIQVTDTQGHLQTLLGPGLTVTAPFVALSETVSKITLPAAVIAGAKTKGLVILKITNNGNVPSTGTTTARLYASLDGNVTGATLINSVTKSITIKPGKFTLFTVPISSLPASLNGTYSIVAEVADPNAVRTTVNSNTQVTVAPAFVALTETILAAAPTTITKGKSVTVTVKISNAGNSDSTGPASINLGLSTDGTTELPNSTTLIKVVKIAAGRSSTLKLKLTIPAALTAGSYFPFVSFTQSGKTVSAFGSTGIVVS